MKKKWLRIPYLFLLYTFAVYGFFLSVMYVAMKFDWTKEKGRIDVNNRYFQNMHDKYNQAFKVDSISMRKHKFEVLNRILILNDFYPQNAEMILKAYSDTRDEKLALQMLDAVEIRLKTNKAFQQAKSALRIKFKPKETTALSAFEWMNIAEWKYFKEAVLKDKKFIDSAACASGVEARLIVACLVGEQVRLFNSRREKFKNFIAPLKTLALETNLSYGVTGIKESTAIKIETYLKDKSSPFYCGEKFENILDYDTISTFSNHLNDTMSVRLQRLIQFSNHYYSYLYAAVFIRQIKTQWQKAGFPIDRRPEILASIFNLGYRKSLPKKNPAAGGSVFKINDSEYTFGSVAFEFYYSGEMFEHFPFEQLKFKD